MRYVILCMALFTSLSFADSHTSAEQTVLANIDAYWVARNTKDWETVVALSSAEGMYNTNSDGSFHKSVGTATVEDWARTTPGDAGTVVVHFSEAHQLNDSTVFARYYAEGVTPDGNGNFKPYRTRVTSVWVLEGDDWVAKTMHFSSASYGGVHQTQATDFED